jgi:hypothetical protein
MPFSEAEIDYAIYEVAFKIEVIEKSGEVTSPHP